MDSWAIMLAPHILCKNVVLTTKRWWIKQWMRTCEFVGFVPVEVSPARLSGCFHMGEIVCEGVRASLFYHFPWDEQLNATVFLARLSEDSAKEWHILLHIPTLLWHTRIPTAHLISDQVQWKGKIAHVTWTVQGRWKFWRIMIMYRECGSDHSRLVRNGAWFRTFHVTNY